MWTFGYTAVVASTVVDETTTKADSTSARSSTTDSLDTNTVELESSTASGNSSDCLQDVVICKLSELSLVKRRNYISLFMLAYEEN